MDIATLIQVYGFIGWLVITAVLLVLYWWTGILCEDIGKRIARIYHLSVMFYWLKRLEREGTHCFKKADSDNEEIGG